MTPNYFKRFFKNIKKDYLETEHLVEIYALISLLGNAIFYVLNQGPFHTYENLGLRLIGIGAATALLFKRYWPEHTKSWLPAFWYGSLCYMLPFFFTFMGLMNGMLPVWQINMIICMVILTLLLNWVALSVLTITGMSLGIGSYIWTSSAPVVPQEWGPMLIGCLSVILYSGLFSRKNRVHNEQKLATLRALSGSIAHEMTTPLNSISLAAEGIQENLGKLIEGYSMAQDAGINIPKIKKSDIKKLEKAPENLLTTSKEATTIIDMLLTKIHTPNSIGQLDTCSVNKCVDQALMQYPMKDEDRKIVHWEKGEDFEFLGKDSLFMHILFNLVKNALYFIHTEGKGDITIWTERDGDYNVLRFQDTSKGIEKKKLRQIFNRFYTDSEHGTGVGLAFCKLVMEEFDGDIRCESIEGEYTQFVLSFPSSSVEAA